jgi:hypothetical protein
MAYSVRRRGRSLIRGRSWIWPGLAFILCAAAVAWSSVVLPVIGGALLLAAGVFFPRTTVGLAVLAIVFVRTLQHLVPIEQLQYLDEVMVVLCAVVLPLRRLGQGQRLRRLPGQGWFVTFAVFGFASGVVAGVTPTILLLGAFVLCKGLIFGWAVAQLDWTDRHLHAAARAGVVVIGVSLLAVAANVVVQGVWIGLLANTGSVDYRLGFPALIGPFVHPLDLGSIMTASSIALLAWRSTVSKHPLTLFLMIATGAAVVLSLRRTAVSGLLVAAVWLKVKLRDTRQLLVLAVVVPIAVVLLFGPLQMLLSLTYDDYIVGAGSSARTVLTADSFSLAVQHFPFGAGFGRFGSEVAAVNYSPEYLVRGYPGIYGLGTTRLTGQFLTDTEWPAVVGETGVLGAGAFVLGLVAVYRRGHQLWKSGASPLMRWAGLLVTGWIVAYLVESIGNPVFTGPPAYGPLFALFGIVAAVSSRETGPARTPEERVPAWRERLRALRIVRSP